MVKYWYGLRLHDGIEEAVSIQDIPEESKGRACGCICPACRRPFEACSLGAHNERARHFKHTKEHNPNVIREGSAGGCDVYTANESGLHKLAKQIIQEERKVMVPSFNLYAEDVLMDIPLSISKRLPPFVVKEAFALECVSIELEKHINEFIPDIVMQLPSCIAHEVLIEINAGHAVDEEKLECVKTHGSPMLEIDVTAFRKNPPGKEELRQFLLENADRREWLYFPVREEVIEKARQHFEKEKAVIQYRKEKSEQEKERAKREKSKARLTELLQPEKYAEEIARLRSDYKFRQACQEYQYTEFLFMKDTSGKAPFYIDVPISGEMIFQCDRRIWQGIIFGRYVYRRTPEEGKGSHIPAKKLYEVLRDDYGIRIDYLLTYKQQLEVKAEGIQTVSLSVSVIQQYLTYLEFLGFIEKEPGQWYEATAIRTTTPPAAENAKFFESMLHEVNGNCFEINHEIDRRMWQREQEEQAKLKEQRPKNEIQALAEELAMLENGDFSIRRPLVFPGGVLMYHCEDCKRVVASNTLFVYVKGGRRGLCKSCGKERLEKCVSKRNAFKHQPLLTKPDPASIFSGKAMLVNIDNLQVFQCKICGYINTEEFFEEEANGVDQNNICSSCWILYKRNW